MLLPNLLFQYHMVLTFNLSEEQNVEFTQNESQDDALGRHVECEVVQQVQLPLNQPLHFRVHHSLDTDFGQVLEGVVNELRQN